MVAISLPFFGFDLAHYCSSVFLCVIFAPELFKLFFATLLVEILAPHCYSWRCLLFEMFQHVKKFVIQLLLNLIQNIDQFQ